MDSLDGSSLKNLFTTKAQPEQIEDRATAPQNVIEVSNHARKSGETYRDYGFRVAGLSEGSNHTLLPCLQSVYFGIKREQENDATLQEELSKKLTIRISELESDSENIKNKIEDSEKHQVEIKKEIEDKKAKLANLNEGRSEKNKSAWITLIISGILLIPFSIYFFIFYSSVGYSAFFKQFDTGNINENILASAIFDSNAIPNAYHDGIAELMFILFMPVIFLAFGFVLNRWEREKGLLKYIKIPLLIVGAFLFDCLLSYEICQKLYDLYAMMQLNAVPPYDVFIAIKEPRFWMIICLGFVSYLIWGFVFGFFVNAWETLDLNPVRKKELEDKIETLKKSLKEEKQNCLNLKTNLNAIGPKIKEIQTQMSVSARYDLAKIKLELNNFFAGWQQYLAALRKTDEEKQIATDIFNNMVNSIKVVE